MTDLLLWAIVGQLGLIVVQLGLLRAEMRERAKGGG